MIRWHKTFIEYRKGLRPFLTLPPHRSIRAASERCRLIFEATVEKRRLRLRLEPQRVPVGVVQPQPLRNKSGAKPDQTLLPTSTETISQKFQIDLSAPKFDSDMS